MIDRIPLDDMTSDQLDQLYADLARTRQELADRAAADSADVAAGSYAGRAERVEDRLARVQKLLDTGSIGCCAHLVRAALAHDDPAIAQPGRWLHVAFTSPDPTTANTSALAIADHLAAEFDGVSMRISSNAVEPATSCSPGAEESEPDNIAPTGLRDQLTAAFRDAACPGDCGMSELDCARRNLQPEVWHHGALAEVSGTPELLADTVLAAVAPQLAALAEYENAVTWHTDCLSCARILDSSIRETERAEKAEDALNLVGERCDTADVLHKAITTADVRAWLKGTRCARQAAAEQPRTTGNNPAGGIPTEETVTRVTDLYEQWVQAGPPPLGASMARWWDRRLVELHNAIRPAGDNPTGGQL